MILKEVFNIGSAINYLRFQTSIRSYVKGEHYILDSMSATLTVLERYELCKSMIDRHRKMIEYFVEQYEEDETEITEEDAEKLLNYVDELRRRIRDDLDEISVIILKGSGGLDKNELEKLSDGDPNDFFDREIWDKLSEIERNDYSDAAKCLLVGVPTPSVMVSLRGAEASLRNFYSDKTQKDPEKMTWRQITRTLKDNISSYDIEESFIEFLNYIGDAKRNFAQHPNKIYTMREASIIFMQIIALVDDIYSKI